jgi:hypothetical protein
MKARLISFFKDWRPKDYVLAISIVANCILGWWCFSIMRDSQKPNEELLRSQGRVEMLERELSELKSDYAILEVKNDSLDEEIAKKPKERVVIKTIYNEKIKTVTNMSLDSNISFISTRLSEINLD